MVQIGLNRDGKVLDIRHDTQRGKNPQGGTLNAEVIGMLVGNFLENPKKYPDFDFKPLKITNCNS